MVKFATAALRTHHDSLPTPPTLFPVVQSVNNHIDGVGDKCQTSSYREPFKDQFAWPGQLRTGLSFSRLLRFLAQGQRLSSRPVDRFIAIRISARRGGNAPHGKREEEKGEQNDWVRV